MRRTFGFMVTLLFSVSSVGLGQNTEMTGAGISMQRIPGGYRIVGKNLAEARKHFRAVPSHQIAHTADSLVVTLGVLRLPDTLTFSQNHVPAFHSEYIWSAWWDVDGNSTNGYLGFDLHIGLVHFKSPGTTPFRETVLGATLHEVVEWTNTGGSIIGQTKHSNLPVRIDPSNSNVLIMSAPKSWVEIARIEPNDRCALITSYYAANGFVEDTLEVRTAAMDPVGDVPFDFIDIISGTQGLITNVGERQDLPVIFQLKQNYPNPFSQIPRFAGNPSTTIEYDLPTPSKVALKIYDVLGQEIRTLVDERQSAGRKSVAWDGKNEFGQPVGAGVYLYALRVNDNVDQRRMLVLK
jgi:hypothetical protein